MTICVAVRISTGLVLVSDRFCSVGSFSQSNPSSNRLLKTMKNKQKIFQVMDLPIGVL